MALLLLTTICAAATTATAFVAHAPQVRGGASVLRRAETDELPPVRYAAETKKKIGDLREGTFVGQYELEEKEDADDCKTLLELKEGGGLVLGQTNGIPFTKVSGRWEFDGTALLIELVREYGTYSTIRFFVGDVIQLDSTPPTVEGPIKMTAAPSDEMKRLLHHPLPDEALGYFIATKIPAVPFTP